MTPSASKLGLLEYCGWWARPEVEWPRQPDDPKRQRGTGLHALLEAHYRALVAGWPLPEPEAFTEGLADGDARLVVDLYRAFLPHPISRVPWLVERAFAWSPETDTARLLPKMAHRDYSALIDGEIPGTPDAHLFEGTTIHVPDFKTGEGNEARDILSAAQGEFNTLAAARTYGADSGITTEVDFTLDGPVLRSRTFDREQLDALAVKFRGQLAGIPSSRPMPGTHCADLWCPAQTVCPERYRAEMGLAPGEALRPEIETPAQAAYALARIGLLRSACDVIEGAIERYTDRAGGSFPLPDGRVFRRVETHPRTIDLDCPGAPQLLVELGYKQAAEIVVTRQALERVARTVHAITGKAAVEEEIEEVFERLAAIGAVRLGTTVSYKPTGKRRAHGRAPDERPAVPRLANVATTDLRRLADEPTTEIPQPEPSPVDGVEF